MMKFKPNERFILLGIFLTMLLVFTPSTTIYGGTGIEPGEGCGLEGLKYVAPPYMGDVTVTLEGDGSVRVTGELEQAGKSECTAAFDEIVGTMELEEFQAIHATDLRQKCIENVCLPMPPFTCPFPCVEGGGHLEVVAVGNMQWLTPTSFKAQFVIMALE